MTLQLTDRSWSELTTIRLPEEASGGEAASARSELSEESAPEEQCEDLWCLASEAGDGAVTWPGGRVELHRVVVEGSWRRVGAQFASAARRLERIAADGETLRLDRVDDSLVEAARRAYGGRGLRAALLRALESGEGADATAAFDGESRRVHSRVLAARSEYFAAAFRYGAHVELAIPARLGPLLLRYAYTKHPRELEALALAALEDGEARDEPLAVSLAGCLNELLLHDAKAAVLDRLAVEPSNAAALLAVARRLEASALRVRCLEVLAARLDEARRDDPFFDENVSRDLRRTLKTLASISRANPVGRGALADAREAVALLRESLDEQTERLVAARRRADDRDARTNAILQGRALRLDYLRDYVHTQESLLFARDAPRAAASPSSSSSSSSSCAVRHPNDDPDDDAHDDDWSYQWRPVGRDAPPGLEFRLVFGGARAARIPLAWQLKLRLPPPRDADEYRTQVTQTTTVADILHDLHSRFDLPGMRRLSLRGRDDQPLHPDRTCDPALWRDRDRLRLSWADDG